MADSSLAMDTADFTTLANQTANDPAEVDDNFTQVITDFNAALETSTGHYHDGTDSRLMYGGVTGWTQETIFLAYYAGLMSKAGVF